ncbi:MAG: RNA polymerase sigma factor [Candidatus Cloacimonetes bacterium]|nr:RNA polymerase sigma factor [Candidatus Cloacimonadota bacterium]
MSNLKFLVSRLASEVIEGNEDSFSELVISLQKPLYAFAYKHLNKPEEAVDAVQETLIRLHKKLQEPVATENLLSWCFTVCRNLCLDLLRNNQKIIYGATLADPSHTPDMTEKLRVSEIHNCLDLLPQESKDIIVLAMEEELSQDDISQILGIPVGTVKSKLHYARKKLRAILRERGYGTET